MDCGDFSLESEGAGGAEGLLGGLEFYPVGRGGLLCLLEG